MHAALLPLTAATAATAHRCYRSPLLPLTAATAATAHGCYSALPLTAIAHRVCPCLTSLSGWSHGFNVAEAVNFAPHDWLPFGRHAMACYRKKKKT